LPGQPKAKHAIWNPKHYLESKALALEFSDIWNPKHYLESKALALEFSDIWNPKHYLESKALALDEPARANTIDSNLT
jgi:hypothetical protein